VTIWNNKEVDLDAADLAPILSEYYNIDENTAYIMICDFYMHKSIYNLYPNDVQEIAEEKWRCNYEE